MLLFISCISVLLSQSLDAFPVHTTLLEKRNSVSQFSSLYQLDASHFLSVIHQMGYERHYEDILKQGIALQKLEMVSILMDDAQFQSVIPVSHVIDEALFNENIDLLTLLLKKPFYRQKFSKKQLFLVTHTAMEYPRLLGYLVVPDTLKRFTTAEMLNLKKLAYHRGQLETLNHLLLPKLRYLQKPNTLGQSKSDE